MILYIEKMSNNNIMSHMILKRPVKILMRNLNNNDQPKIIIRQPQQLRKYKKI